MGSKKKADFHGEPCTIYMDPQIWSTLRQQARDEDRSLRSVVERTIRAGLEALVTS